MDFESLKGYVSQSSASMGLSPIMLLLQGRKPMFDRLEAPDQGWHVNEGKVELTFSPAKCGAETHSPPVGCSGNPTD